MLRDPRVSRIPKSETISTHVETQYCRERFFNTRVLHFGILRHADYDGDDEAKWLFRTLKDIDNSVFLWIEKELLKHDTSPRALYYYERIYLCLCNNIVIDLFSSGRILEGYSNIEDERCTVVKRTMTTYLNCMYRARIAALQVVVGLRPLLGRDVATLIGKFVYSTRDLEWTN
jgi:hypothetical protein